MPTISLRNELKKWLRSAKYTIAWKYPRVYLFLVVNFKLKRSLYWRIIQQYKNKELVPFQSVRDNVPVHSIQRKRILFAIHWYELGGAESYALYTIRQAHELGHTCFSVSTVPSEHKELQSFGKYCAASLVYSQDDSKVDFNQFISNYIRKNSIDVVHVHHSTLMYEALPALKRQFPNLLVVDSTHIVEYGNGGFPRLSAKFTNFIDKHNVISKNLALVQNDLSKRENRSEIDSKKFHLTYLSSLSHRENVTNSPDPGRPKIITFYGRLVLQKQPNIFVKVIEHLFSKYPDLDAEAHIYGEGEMQVKLVEKIEQSAFRSRIHFLGRCDDKETVFANTDILLLTSLNEGIALTAYEALEFNRLVVSSNVGAQSELLCNNCLVPLSTKFISKTAIQLSEFLTDDNRYFKALSESLQKLTVMRKMEVNRMEIQKLYESKD